MIGLILYFTELLKVPHDEHADEFQNYTLGLAIELVLFKLIGIILMSRKNEA